MAMQAPNPGELRANLRFERRGSSDNVGGVVKAVWATIDQCESFRCKVTPTRGGEEVIAGRLSGKVQYDIWVRSGRATRGLRNTDRAVDNRTGEVYNLGTPIDPFSDRMWLLIQSVSDGIATNDA